MSERMRPIPFEKLLRWMLEEHGRRGMAFGVTAPYVKGDGRMLPLFKERLETPFGPAAGPNTQLAQNIIAAYYAGSRFFELKTVQKMDGAELAACIGRPCILAEDEGYNCEWSTELTVEEAFSEYVKAWFALKIISRLWGLGDPEGFMFNMSVGYDLAGIRSGKMDRFIDGMRDASHTPIFRECMEAAKALLPDMAAYIETIPGRICDGVTVSTLHGCPPGEIEAIAGYLLREKRLNTFVKCNPTILGYEFARKRLDEMGFDYIAFDDHHFKEDLQYEDALPMFRRLKALAEGAGLEFGLKLSNTFPVDVRNHELPSQEMYMSGRALYPLTIEMARRFSRDFDGALRISFSGGAEYFNITDIFSAGIWPITMATTILKPGGYGRMVQLAKRFERVEYKPFNGVDVKAVARLSKRAPWEPRHRKPAKALPSPKMAGENLPLLNCFAAPCKTGCPLGQDIPEYIELSGKGLFWEALQVITDKNPLPFITGTICAHHCSDRCMRNHYEAPVDIRRAKLAAAEAAHEELLALTEAPGVTRPESLAIIGGGPAGMAAAYFGARAGMKVTLFEKRESLGGIVRHVIPDFRIQGEAVERDAALVRTMGAEFCLGQEAPADLSAYSHVLLACGAEARGSLDIEGNVVNAVDFLQAYKREGDRLQLGRSVAVVGGGNTAMDAARAAMRLESVENVYLVYRRTQKYMPADGEELELALAEGVEFMELLSPIKQEGGKLRCMRMALGQADAGGRRRPVETGETVTVPADVVIAAVGERIDPGMQRRYPGAIPIGDAKRGPATVAEAIGDARAAVEAILGQRIEARIPQEAQADAREALLRKMELGMPAKCEAERCLSCNTVCECCVSVCPNRANVAVEVCGRPQILHVDYMCNECGNCAAFCPYEGGRPYRDKLTLFGSEADFADSGNLGFLPLENGKIRLRYGERVEDYGREELPNEVAAFIKTVLRDYAYLL